MLLIGFLSLPVIIGIIQYNQPISASMKHKAPGKVLATTMKGDLLRCDESGFTLVELNSNKEIIILCGVQKAVGENISVTVVGNPSIHI